MGKIWNLLDHTGKTALVDEFGNQMRYEDLESESCLLAEKVGRRCLVFSLCRNEIGSVLGYTAFINHGIVPVMLSSSLDAALLEKLLAAYSPEYLWVPQDQAGRFAGMKAAYASRRYILFQTGYTKQYPLHDELALLMTTSGSTGSPKFVRQSYTNVSDNARSIATYLHLDDTERPITTLPMNYVYGLSIINSHFLVGATLLLTDKGLMQKEFWSFFKQAQATSFGGVPYTYEMLDKLRFYRMALPSLRTLTQAGGKIAPTLHQKFAEYAQANGKQFVVMYGAAEATSRMGYLPAEKAAEKKGSMGIPIPGGAFHLIGADGQTITAPWTTGELIYEGKNVTLGYAECADDLIKGDERHGILATGDMAQFDEEGYYYIVGRKKRFLKIYGNRVNLDEIDRLIVSAFGIEAASTGVDDHLYIFITDGSQETPVREYIIEKTGLNPTAIRVSVIDNIPKNDAGKTLYHELNKLFAG